MEAARCEVVGHRPPLGGSVQDLEPCVRIPTQATWLLAQRETVGPGGEVMASGRAEQRPSGPEWPEWPTLRPSPTPARLAEGLQRPGSHDLAVAWSPSEAGEHSSPRAATSLRQTGQGPPAGSRLGLWSVVRLAHTQALLLGQSGDGGIQPGLTPLGSEAVDLLSAPWAG